MRIPHRRQPATALAVAAALAASASGQTLPAVPAQANVVVPVQESGRPWLYPLFHNACPTWAPLRYQFLFRVPGTSPVQVRTLAFRRFDVPGSPVSSVAWPSFTVTLELWMAHSPNTPAQYSMLYAANRGADHQLVVAKRPIQFPAQSPQANNQYPFSYRIPLDVPFVFQPGTTGLVEMRVESSTLCINAQNRYFGIEAWSESQRDHRATLFGAPCRRYPPDNELVTSALRVGNSGYAIMTPQRNASFNATAQIHGGLSKTTWAGVPLPYSLAPLGAPGCSLYISFDWVWPHVWPRNGGFALATLDIPNAPSLVGRKIYVQGARFDRAINPLGLATSQAAEITLGPHLDAHGSMLAGPFGPESWGTGSRYTGGCPVMLLDPR